MKRILLTGGGTGGHVYPLIAVAEALRKVGVEQREDVELHYMGSVGEYRKTFEEKGVVVHPIVAGKLRRYFSLLNILDVPKFFIGLVQAWFKVYFLMPDAIFSKGGTGALPVLMAGWFYRIPIMLHESDTVPGLNNLLGAYLAKRVGVNFESALKYFSPKKGIRTGSPLRRSLLENQASQEKAKQILGFEVDKPLVVVLGGSQGSQAINELVLLSLPRLITMAQVLHQTGEKSFLEVEKLARTDLLETPVAQGNVPLRYKAIAYLGDDMVGTALSAADLIISRSGSMIFEFAAFGKPVILIPLQNSANGHQVTNGYEFAEKGGGIVIEESNLLPDIFLAQISAVLNHPEKKTAMETASRAFFVPNAAEQIASEILALAN